MTGHAPWARSLGRHRALPTVSETPMSPSLAASLPLSPYQRQPPGTIAAAVIAESEAPPVPDKIVECGFCKVSRPASQMTSVGGGQYRCDIQRPESDGCVQRYIRWRETGAKPAPILSSPLEPLPEPEPPVLPAAQEAALAAFNEASDEQDAAEGKDLSEDEAAASLPDVPGPGAVPRDEPTAATGGQHDGTAHASTGRSEVNPGPGTPAPPPAGTTEPAPVADETEPEEGGEGE